MIKRKSIFGLILAISLLSACDSGGLVEDQKPEYLTVLQAFQKTDKYQRCLDYQDKLGNKELNNEIMPYDTNLDVDIMRDSYGNGIYRAELVCKYDVTYSLSASTFVHKQYKKQAGWIEIKR